MNTSVKQILLNVKSGSMTVEEALLQLKEKPFEDLGFAKVDLHRQIRQGATEVIYGAGKTPEQITAILSGLIENGQERVLITRLEKDKADEVAKRYAIRYDPVSRTAVMGGEKKPDGIGPIVIASAGTSDMPVAEEAAVTAAFLGNEVVRLYDVGVSGLHRLLAHKDEIMGAAVIVAVAGMEGALASVVAGLADCPVVAVPTSVGYGASFQGLSALLSMLNACSGGIGVVNIDNGFGAAVLASRINHMENKK